MEEKETLLETLFEKTDVYAKTTLDLFKLKAIDKSADVVSSLVARLAIVIIVFSIILMVNIGIALWLGDLLGKLYYGFFSIAAFYLVVVLILHYNRGRLIKTPVNDSIIAQMLKEK